MENVENGVVIKIISTNPEIAKKIQEKISKIQTCCKETEKCKKEEK